MEYIILDKEKNAIKRLLDEDYLIKYNFYINEFKYNEEKILENPALKDIYREFGGICKNIANVYSGIKKQYQNKVYEQEKYKKDYGEYIELTEEVEKIYIPISLAKLEKIANKPFNEFLIGTTGKFIAETKPYQIEDLVILSIAKNDVPYFSTTDDFPDILTRILVPPFTIKTSKMEILDIKEKFIKAKKGIKDSKKLNDSNDLNDLNNKEKGFDKKKKIIDENRVFLNATLSKIDSGYLDITSKIEKLSSDYELIDPTFSDLKYNENKIVADISDAGIEIYNAYREHAKLKKQLEDLQIELQHIKESKEQNKEQRIKKNQIEKEINIMKENINKNNQKIGKYEKTIKNNTKKMFDQKEKEMQRQKIKENPGITQVEMIKYMDLDRALRSNINKTEKILEDVENLIKSQKKFAKIGAEANAGYASIIDGFKIRSEAEKLRQRLEQIYREFEAYYFNKLQKKAIQEDYERKLGRILESANQIEIFLNYLYNPKSVKKNSKINRFEELVLIEENELKRIICKTAENLIAKANLLIIDDELDAIEFKNTAKKILDLITGKRKIEKYRELKLEEAAEKVQEKLEKEYTINKNYKIHDIIAEIMIFKAENLDDELIEEYIDKLNILERGIVKNFVIDEEKILKKIDELKGIALPMDIQKMSKEDEVDLEMAILYHKYGYNEKNEEEKVEYNDTSANEIKQILDYIKMSF